MAAKAKTPPSAAQIITRAIARGKTNAEALAAAKKVHPRSTLSLPSVNYFRNRLRDRGLTVPSDKEARRRAN